MRKIHRSWSVRWRKIDNSYLPFAKPNWNSAEITFLRLHQDFPFWWRFIIPRVARTCFRTLENFLLIQSCEEKLFIENRFFECNPNFLAHNKKIITHRRRKLTLFDGKIFPPIFLSFTLKFHARVRSRWVCNRFELNLDRNWRKCATAENLLCLLPRCSVENLPLENSLSKFSCEHFPTRACGSRKMCVWLWMIML